MIRSHIGDSDLESKIENLKSKIHVADELIVKKGTQEVRSLKLRVLRALRVEQI